MRFLLLNQTFHPDVVATSLYLTDVAKALGARGHEVTVITGRRAYDDDSKYFSPRETWNGIDIQRVWSTRLGKGAKWKRACDFASFICSCSLKLLFVRRPDCIVALTSPPLISFIAACFASLRRTRFVYWVMDLNPDEAIAAGWLREKSLVARFLNALSVFSLRRANAIIALDRFMRARILPKLRPHPRPCPPPLAPSLTPLTSPLSPLFLLPPWSHDESVRFDPAGRDTFRAANGLDGKFVVMYSGNHSPCHPLTNLLEAAKQLASDDHIRFCFIGGGSEFPKVQQFAAGNGLRNILCLPYRPLDQLAGSLSAADLHVVVMGDPFVGTIHPCKLYNIMGVAAPILYIGPAESHVADILREIKIPNTSWSVSHDDIPATVAAIRAAAAITSPRDTSAYDSISSRFTQATLLPSLLAILEGK